jgi:hypothetical protein
MAKDYLHVYKLLGVRPSSRPVSGRGAPRETPVGRGIEINDPTI